jgi:NADPH:quinone reductase
LVPGGEDWGELSGAASATHLVDGDTPDLAGVLRGLGGADVVYDPVGGPAFDAAFRAARPEGRIVVIGFASGTVPQIKANHLLVKNLTVSGFWWGGYLEFRPDVVADSLRRLLGWYAEGRLHPHVGATLPFDRAAEGLALLRDRKVTGKVVVTLR